MSFIAGLSISLIVGTVVGAMCREKLHTPSWIMFFSYVVVAAACVVSPLSWDLTAAVVTGLGMGLMVGVAGDRQHSPY